MRKYIFGYGLILIVLGLYVKVLYVSPVISSFPSSILKGNYGILFWIFDGLLVFSVFTGTLITIYNREWRKVVLVLWFVIPAVGLALFGKVLYPRFIFFMTLPVLLLAAYALDYVVTGMKKVTVGFAVMLSLFVLPLYVDAKILYSISTAPIPRSDSGQYVHDWPAGWGVREAVDIFQRESLSHDLVVYTDGTFGLMPYGLEIYLVDNPRIRIKGLYPSPETYTDEMISDIGSIPTYYVANQISTVPSGWNAEEISRYKKGKSTAYLRIYRLREINE